MPTEHDWQTDEDFDQRCMACKLRFGAWAGGSCDKNEGEWVLFYGGPDPDNCAGTLPYDSHGEAEEMLQWIPGAGIAARTITYGPWIITEGEADDKLI